MIAPKKSLLDKFYTNPLVAEQCIQNFRNHFNLESFEKVIEPSAGNGSFYNLLPINTRIGLDLAPEHPEIWPMDFFNLVLEPGCIAVIGNPPFGRMAGLAVSFFNHAAQFAQVIAFIVPKTFRKQSIQQRLNSFFWLKQDWEIPKNAFLIENEPYNVPCCFQVWERQTQARSKTDTSIVNNYVCFVDKTEAELVVRRAGGRAGKASLEIETASEASNYFLQIQEPLITPDETVELINSIDYSAVVDSTAGARSLSRPEFLSGLLNRIGPESTMSKKQTHGNDFQRMIAGTHPPSIPGVPDLENATWDIAAIRDPSGIETEIKFHEASSLFIDSADARKWFGRTTPIRLTIGSWIQESKSNKICRQIDDYLIPVPVLQEWQGNLLYAIVEDFHNTLRTFPFGSAALGQSYHKIKNKELTNTYTHKIKLRPKVSDSDGKCQRRLQCSIPIELLSDSRIQHSIYTTEYRGLYLPLSFHSSAREFN